MGVAGISRKGKPAQWSGGVGGGGGSQYFPSVQRAIIPFWFRSGSVFYYATISEVIPWKCVLFEARYLPLAGGLRCVTSCPLSLVDFDQTCIACPLTIVE